MNLRFILCVQIRMQHINTLICFLPTPRVIELVDIKCPCIKIKGENYLFIKKSEIDYEK